VGLCEREFGGWVCATEMREGVGGGFVRMSFGKWFTEIFSVNRFPKFTEGFYGKKNKRFPLTKFYTETNVRK
jgi:hypothetical protein